MLYWLSHYVLEACKGTGWEEPLSWLRLFRYITVRSAGAAVTALTLSWWLGPKVIRWLKRLSFGQNYEDIATQAGQIKGRSALKFNVPTMGGLMIVMTLSFTTLLWAEMNPLVELTLLSVVVLAGLGFYDDYTKITEGSGKGAKPRVKLLVQVALALFIGLYLWKLPVTSELRFPENQAVIVSNLVSVMMVPFYKHPIAVGVVVGLLLTLFAIVGSSNAVNLTDGLDGLAIGCTLMVSLVFLIFTYLASNFKTAGYLQIPYVAGAGELTVFCAGMIGAGLGFLWFNCHPAMVFMGDTGSLALGGALGIIAVLIHQPFVLLIAGGVFVMEAGSVLMQTSYFKFSRWRTGTGRRIFLMTPIHHHFEKKNWHESQVVTRFYILCVLFAVVALSTLKIR
jgi:phospho-N-acetylmuramoyl-pentapeptide-transferase